MDNKRMTLNEFGKALEDELDFDFSVSEKRIESLDEFDKELMARFNSGEGRIFYRGESLCRLFSETKKNCLKTASGS